MAVGGILVAVRVTTTVRVAATCVLVRVAVGCAFVADGVTAGVAVPLSEVVPDEAGVAVRCNVGTIIGPTSIVTVANRASGASIPSPHAINSADTKHKLINIFIFIVWFPFNARQGVFFQVMYLFVADGKKRRFLSIVPVRSPR